MKASPEYSMSVEWVLVGWGFDCSHFISGVLFALYLAKFVADGDEYYLKVEESQAPLSVSDPNLLWFVLVM